MNIISKKTNLLVIFIIAAIAVYVGLRWTGAIQSQRTIGLVVGALTVGFVWSLRSR